MSLFQSSRFIPLRVADFSPAAADVINHFRALGYEVAGTPLLSGAWHISLSKGGMFKAVLGMKTALNIDIQPSSTGTLVTAGVGIFGQQAIPTAITMLLFWPVLIPQIWGLIQQAHLDDEAVALVEQRLAAYGAPAGAAAGALPAETTRFCVACGAANPADARFCPHCGAKVG